MKEDETETKQEKDLFKNTTGNQKAFWRHNNQTKSTTDTKMCLKTQRKKTERQLRCFCVVHLWAADMETSSYMSMTRCCFGACTSCAAWLHTEVHKGKKNMLAIILKLLLTAGDANNKEGISTNQTGKSTANTLYMWEHILLDVNGI